MLREIYKSLSRHLGSVGDACSEVKLRKTRIVLQDLVMAHAFCEHVQDEGDPDSVPSYARFAETDIWVDRDPPQELVLCFTHPTALLVANDAPDSVACSIVILTTLPC